VLSDANERHLITVENGVLIHEAGVTEPDADATVTMTRDDLLQTLLAAVPVLVKTVSGAIQIEGRSGAYGELTALIDPVDSNFPIVTP
jgi:alkyl sulfatase BDS1-like metallo-beta-lactamase superfamily hydrolase